MAADKTLVAGAAAIAQAQYELDTATTTGLQEFGKRYIDAMAKTEESLQAARDLITEEFDDVTEYAEGAVDDLEDKTGADNIKNPQVLSKLTPILNKIPKAIMGSYNIDGGLSGVQKYVQTPEYLSEYDKTFKDARWLTIFDETIESSRVREDGINNDDVLRSFMSDPLSPNGQLAKSMLKGDFKLNDTPSDWKEYNRPFTIGIDGEQYPAGRITDALKEYNVLANPTWGMRTETDIERDFKGAKTDAQADLIAAKIKRDNNSIEKLEKFLTSVNGENVGVYRLAAQEKGVFNYDTAFDEKGNMKPNEEYQKHLTGLLDGYISNMKNIFYTPPKVEEVDEPEGDTPHFIAQEAMLDKIISKFNRYRVGEKPGIDYYLSQEFQEMLPPAFTYFKHKGKVQIQAKGGAAKTEHMIDPSMSLEYNINMLKPMLLSKKK